MNKIEMMAFLQRPLVIKVLILALIALVFSAYLRPEMMVNVANTLLTLCGW
ncbi:MAG: hypothetical protein RIQ84_1668 [Pseudomonadota bacterium]|jgi:hypothetical protein